MIIKGICGSICLLYMVYLKRVGRVITKGGEEFENAVTRFDCFEDRFRICI